MHQILFCTIRATIGVVRSARLERRRRGPRQRPFSALIAASAAIFLLVVGLVAAASGGHGSAAKHHHATTSPTTTSSSGVDPSGQPMPVGDVRGWHQVFTDNFTTNVRLGSFPSAVSSKWGAYPDGWHDTSGRGTYMPSKVVSVQNGVMNLHIHTENGIHMVAVPYPLIPRASSHNGRLYGRYAVRFRADPLAGYKTAFLLWPDSEVWPRDGEIDFPEGNLNTTISAFMHRQGGTRGGADDAYRTSKTYPSWHTAVIQWGPSATTFILDGATIGTSTRGIPKTPMHWVLQTETALHGRGPSHRTAGDVQIDWVTVYRPASGRRLRRP
jgi:hypothetical protein